MMPSLWAINEFSIVLVGVLILAFARWSWEIGWELVKWWEKRNGI